MCLSPVTYVYVDALSYLSFILCFLPAYPWMYVSLFTCTWYIMISLYRSNHLSWFVCPPPQPICLSVYISVTVMFIIHASIHASTSPSIILSIQETFYQSTVSSLAPSLFKFLQADQSHSPYHSIYLPVDLYFIDPSAHPSLFFSTWLTPCSCNFGVLVVIIHCHFFKCSKFFFWVCGVWVALPINHKPENKIDWIISRCWEISTKFEELVGNFSRYFWVIKLSPTNSRSPGVAPDVQLSTDCSDSGPSPNSPTTLT